MHFEAEDIFFGPFWGLNPVGKQTYKVKLNKQ